MNSSLISPHDGTLTSVMPLTEQAAGELKKEALELPSWDLSEIQVCDVEMLQNGAFSPLTGFMTRADYNAVCNTMKLADGKTVWPMPITLDVTHQFAEMLTVGRRIVLRHPEGMALAIMNVEDIWDSNPQTEAATVFKTNDTKHPAVFHLMHKAHPVLIGGKLEGIETPRHYSFQELRHTPAELRDYFTKNNITNVVAFQTRNPLHRAHVELTLRASEKTNAHLLINPVVGYTRPGDIDYFVRVRCYKAVLTRYPEKSTSLSLLPLAMRMGGPREAVWHAIIRKNYGCNHFIVGRDHAGPGKDSTGKPFYGPYDAQELLVQYAPEIGVSPVTFEEMVYVSESDSYRLVSQVPKDVKPISLSGTELRKRLSEGSDIPTWFSYPEVINELRLNQPPKHKQGFVVFFTGLPSSGKSTISTALVDRLLELEGRPITLLDGDIVRKNLSSELTFSKEHRDLNILRIGFVAAEIAKHRGIAICAPIAPYAAIRQQVRNLMPPNAGFVEVFVDTPVAECEQRDRKGLYAKARAGIIKGFTGIDDPYEAPQNPEVRINTLELEPLAAANKILDYLRLQGYIK